MRKTQLGFGTLLATSLLTWNAFGQDAPPAEEPAPPPADPQPEAEPAPAPKAEAKVEAKVELDAKAKKKKAKKGGDDEDGEEGEEAVEGEDTGRFRGGVSGIIGVFLPGPVIQLGVEGRLGYQINDLSGIRVPTPARFAHVRRLLWYHSAVRSAPISVIAAPSHRRTLRRVRCRIS